MLIENKIGNVSNFIIKGKTIDLLSLEWYETRKKILRKKTVSGRELSLKFLNEKVVLTEGDILLDEETVITAISILPCDSIVIEPKNAMEIASICYEIGNRHLPLFFEKDLLMTPLDIPLFNLLLKQGYTAKKENRKLLQSLNTTVAPHNIGFSEDFVLTIM
jgi:urease accessory protein